MKYVVPGYYKEFHCIADKCQHNCCEGGWLIELGEDTVKNYEKLEGDFGETVRKSLMRDEEGSWCFRLQEGRCPHLDASGLCRIYGELGEEYMGIVCREFPRFTLYYGDTKEMGIGLACEEAARIILGNTKEFILVCETKQDKCVRPDKQDKSDNQDNRDNLDNHDTLNNYDNQDNGDVLFSIEETDSVLEELLFVARGKIFEMIWTGDYSFKERVKNILCFSQILQDVINTEDDEEMVSFCEKLKMTTKGICAIENILVNTLLYAKQLDEEPGKKSCETFRDAKVSNSRKETAKLLLDIYNDLELLMQEWPDRMEAIEDILAEGDIEDVYASINQGECIQKNMLSYFIYRYFMKAVYDYNVSVKIRLSVTNYLILSAIFANLKCKKDDGGINDKLNFDNIVEEARIFSRQVEYSEDNIETICEELNFGDELSEEKLMDFFV